MLVRSESTESFQKRIATFFWQFSPLHEFVSCLDHLRSNETWDRLCLCPATPSTSPVLSFLSPSFSCLPSPLLPFLSPENTFLPFLPLLLYYAGEKVWGEDNGCWWGCFSRIAPLFFPLRMTDRRLLLDKKSPSTTLSKHLLCSHDAGLSYDFPVRFLWFPGNEHVRPKSSPKGKGRASPLGRSAHSL